VTGRDSQRVRSRLLALRMVGTSHDLPGARAEDEHKECDLEGAPLVVGESREGSERLNCLVFTVVHHFS
jgi:hypothetical protein